MYIQKVWDDFKTREGVGCWWRVLWARKHACLAGGLQGDAPSEWWQTFVLRQYSKLCIMFADKEKSSLKWHSYMKNLRNQDHGTADITAGEGKLSSCHSLFTAQVLLRPIDLQHNCEQPQEAVSTTGMELSRSSFAVYSTLGKKTEECRGRKGILLPQICFIQTEIHWIHRFFFSRLKDIPFHCL